VTVRAAGVPASTSKLRFPTSCLGLSAFADLRLFGEDRGSTVPLVVYIGGAISESKYEARRDSEPIEIFDVFAALHDRYKSPFAVLVVPCPPIVTPDKAHLRALFLNHLDRELLPSVGAPISSLAFVGFSFGAFLATFAAAAHSDRTSALATIAGVGMTDGWRLSGSPPGRCFPPVRCWVNENDPCLHYSVEFEAALHASGGSPIVHRAGGGHRFADYLDNGTVREAFSFALVQGLSQG
jgi:pimeloyl-ACP methyl ester carboxylesterase